MTCRPILDNNGSEVGHICFSNPSMKQYTAHKEVKWCFSCRQYEVHNERAWFEDWYGWSFYMECPTCNKDDTRFSY